MHPVQRSQPNLTPTQTPMKVQTMKVKLLRRALPATRIAGWYGVTGGDIPLRFPVYNARFSKGLLTGGRLAPSLVALAEKDSGARASPSSKSRKTRAFPPSRSEEHPPSVTRDCGCCLLRVTNGNLYTHLRHISRRNNLIAERLPSMSRSRALHGVVSYCA